MTGQGRLQRLTKGRRGLVALVCKHGQGLEHHPVQLLGDGRVALHQWNRLFGQVLAHQGVDGVCPVGRLAAQQLVADGPQGVDVRPGVHRLGVLALLGRHVEGRAEDGAGLGVGAAGLALLELGDAEVQDLDPLAPRHQRVGDQHDVLRLEVTMDHALSVDLGQRRG